MSARRLSLLLVLACASCGPDAATPNDAGVSPEGPSPAIAPAQPKVDLAAPTAVVEPVAETPSEVAAPPAKLAFEIAPYGAFEVVTWAEATRRADARIDAANANEELRRIRQDLLTRRRH